VQHPPPAGWYTDPFGRHEHRYWDGIQWTDHVGSGGRQGVDAPQAQAGVPTGGRTSKAAHRQVRKAGAADGQAGGGTLPGATDGQAGGGTLFTEQVLVINQKAKPFGSTVGYAVYNQNGQQLGTVQELRRDLATLLSDRLRVLGATEATRAHRFQLVDMSGRILLAMTRPEMGWFQTKAKLVIEGPGGTPIGEIAHESFGVGGSIAAAAHAGIDSASSIAILKIGGVAGMVAGAALEGVQKRLTPAMKGLDKVGHARFGLEADGQRLGSIHAEGVDEWDFEVRDPSGAEIARITKTWAGWARERFTNADNYVVQMHRPLEDPLRSLVIAAALAIDVELKQGARKTGGTRGKRRYT
jgi:hypothetical protein